ncbi:hypothetical protein VTN77DRAFT_9328 [Rasamsonia byssochlamydoides]|uniref:uncharacterized protein n=1 Tax=Rasamsonia byssochlamydoides TaxID=89139 RepID=UPI003743786E
MLALHITLYALLGTALAFSFVELGLLAYAIWALNQVVEVPVYDYGFDFTYEDVKIGTPAIIAFLMFAAVWTILASGAALGLPLLFHAQGKHAHNTWFAPFLIVLYFVTWVFWLAGFADVAAIIGDTLASSSYIDAIIAFAVLLWLIFVALFILSFLAIFDILKAEWPGYLPMRSRTTTTAAPAAAVAQPTISLEPKIEAGNEISA